LKFRKFEYLDWRSGGKGLMVHEWNFIGRRWNLRIMFPRFGLRLWRDYEPVFSFNYRMTA
jgi:hypothetical protein